MSHKLKDSIVKSFPLPASGNKVHFDAEVKGFGVRVTTAGHRSFVLDYRFHGRQRRYTIGDFPTWSTGAAREEAQRLKRLIDTGTDPQGVKEVLRIVTIAYKRITIVDIALTQKRRGFRRSL